MSAPPATTVYPGNPSLPVEVREKIMTTFRHALGLFSSGQVSDCLIGCEFILKMDPRFTPARKLQEKAKNREADVDVSELQAIANGDAAPAAPPPAVPRPAPGPAAAPPPPPAPRPERADPEKHLDEAGRKFAQRDFDGAIAAASRALAISPGNPQALALVEKAAGKKATQPLVESGRQRAEQAIDDGLHEEAHRELERMRAVDPEHPAVTAIAARLTAATTPPSDLDYASDDPAGMADQFEATGPVAREAALIAEAFDSRAASAAAAPQPAPGENYEHAPYILAPLSPGEEALVPPSPPTPDLFVAPEGGAATPLFEAPADEEDSQAAAKEISTLLKQGDDIAAKGDRQQAIEIWSRVFLIDINNAEAVTRIEKARQEMAEEGRMVADLLKKGRESFEAGDREAAKGFFLQAQALDPDEATARFYLERIEQEIIEAPAASGTSAMVPSPIGEDQPFEAAPAPVAAPAPPPRRAGLRIQPRVLALVGAFLAMTLVGVYFVFKGGKTQEAPAKVVTGGSLQRARDLLGKGKIADARAELRRIGPGDPDAEEAKKMLAELGRGGAAESAGKAPAIVEPAGAAPREPRGETDPERLRAAAEKALSEKRYIEALKNFNLAAPSFRDDPNFAQSQGLAAEKVTALTPAVKFYNEGEYETAIPILWRIVQEDRENQDARSYLLRAYYNQGITQLQNGLYQKAMQAFQEALALDPNDAEAARHRKFAERYQKGDLDLMGRIYVRHLNHRP